MCSKNIHTLKEWREEMLRLKKQAGPTFETDPEYVKTAQCKEDILSKSDCAKLMPQTKKPSPKPRPKPQTRYNPTSPPKPRPKPPTKTKPNAAQEQQYKDYLKRFAEYNINKAHLKRLKELFMTLNRERSILILKLNSIISQIDDAKAKLTRHAELLLSKLESFSDAKMAIHKAELKKKKEAIAKMEETKKEYEVQIQAKEKYTSIVIEEIEVLTIKTEVRPVPPPNYKEPNTTKTRTAKASPKKRCPNGTRRNKITKLCEKN
jgi:hypothetical protein